MKDVSEMREEARASTMADFVHRHPYPVVLARQLLAGQVRRREPATRPRRPTPPMGEEHTVQTRIPLEADSVYAGTVAHVKPSRAPGPGPDVLQDRELSGEKYAALRKAAHGEAGGPVSLGRSARCDVVLSDFTVSAQHAHVLASADGRGFALVDADSTNGTWVGGRKLVPGRPHPIRSGERLVLGRLVLRFLTPQDFYRLLSAPVAARRRA